MSWCGLSLSVLFYDEITFVCYLCNEKKMKLGLCLTGKGPLGLLENSGRQREVTPHPLLPQIAVSPVYGHWSSGEALSGLYLNTFLSLG
jgi:hypothetical protein